ncbi:MAG: helix-hairpin-helix domain-containing protein [Candidatus Nealsonbacteria bacterium]
MKKMSRGVIIIAIFCLSAINFISAAEKIDINSAPLENLLKIIHIGESRALELISLRPFSSLDELIKIKGIGEKRLQDIKNQGIAWVNPPNLPSSTFEPLRSESQTTIKETNLQSPEIFKTTDDTSAQKPAFPALTAAAVAVFSGTTIFILKKRLR